jgi:hypothetical protein
MALKKTYFVSALSIYLERIDAFLFHEFLELMPVLRHLQVVSPLPAHTEKKIDDNRSINMLCFKHSRGDCTFVGQSPANNLWDPDIFAAL